MTQTILHINASGTTDGSVSRAATARLIADMNPARVITRDLAATPLPQIDETWITARMVPEADRTDADRAALALSDDLIAELRAADAVVIGLPIYNFGMPAALKAWIDLIARPKVTFAYSEAGPVGLLPLAGRTAAICTQTTRTDIQYLAHTLDAKGMTMFFDEPELHGFCPAKN